MRDTVASQSLILESVLPFGVKSTTGSSVLLRGMEGGVIEVPLTQWIFIQTWCLGE